MPTTRSVPPADDIALSIPLNKNGPVPMYVQIADGLRALVKTGSLQPGSALLPERILCEAYGVSRMTLRQSIQILENEGLIQSQRGRGTFVANSRLQKKQQQLRSFTEEIIARGSAPSSQMLSFRLVDLAADAREFFGLGEGDRAYEICRLRLSDGVPLALETVLIPEKLCPGLDRFDLTSHSLYRILEHTYGLKLARCVEQISAVQPDRRQRQELNLPAGAAVLLVRRRTYTKDDRPMELTTAAYRGDAYTAIVHSVREPR